MTASDEIINQIPLLGSIAIAGYAIKTFGSWGKGKGKNILGL